MLSPTFEPGLTCLGKIYEKWLWSVLWWTPLFIVVFFNAGVSPSSDPPFFWINKFGRLFILSYLSFNLKKGNWDSLATDYVEIPGKNNLQYFRRVLAFSFIFSLLVLCLLHAAFIWDNHWPHCKFYCHLANLWDGKGKTHFELN